MLTYLEKHSKLSWTITLLIAIFIFYMSSQSFTAGAPGPEFTLKPIIYHIAIFFLLAFFLFLALIKGKHKKLIFLAILISILYAISDEVHQLFVPGRNGSINDILLDTIGILTATFIYSIRIKKI